MMVYEYLAGNEIGFQAQKQPVNKVSICLIPELPYID
jgi:hypothetical protein